MDAYIHSPEGAGQDACMHRSTRPHHARGQGHRHEVGREQRSKNMPRKAKRKLGDPLTEDELQAAFERMMTDPVLGFINEVSLADTQEEVADILAEHRDWLRSLPRKKREDILRHVNEMIDEKPVIEEDDES